MYCTSCGTQNPDGARFCSKCGNSFPPISPESEQQHTVPKHKPQSGNTIRTVLAGFSGIPVSRSVLVFCQDELIIRKPPLGDKWAGVGFLIAGILMPVVGLGWLVALAVIMAPEAMAYLDVAKVRKTAAYDATISQADDTRIPIDDSTSIRVKKSTFRDLLFVSRGTSHIIYEGHIARSSSAKLQLLYPSAIESA